LSEDDARIEALLTRYRPVGPPAELRTRVLQASAPRQIRWTAAAGWAIAASLLLSIGLNSAVSRLTQDSIRMLGIGQIEWKPGSDEYAPMLGSEVAGRDYMALAMAADSCRSKGVPLQVSLAGIPGVRP
jgi:hypothetical protein